ncbi:unnamed protein product [Peronospora belbahrii]|uniref:Uncharacterized protein n=1 Tax=Peronospora belbahrii TaxID=622444 RepID=A0AAU9L8N6_9STRA|nr:unnamed protein product [Peronospora belbahrii]
MLARCLQTLSGTLKLGVGSNSNLLAIRNVSGKSVHEDWRDFNNVVKELRNISRENGLEGEMPDTKLLKELGYGALVMAIRKKHGGVVEVATKMGARKDHQVVEVHKKISARCTRRKKRKERLDMHDFY